MNLIQKILLTTILFLGTTASQYSLAEPPVLSATGPLIALADSLDQEQPVGWCIDTIGPGINEKLHTRDCSPDEDVETRDFSFTFDAVSGRIASATFANKCISVKEDDNKSSLRLFDCDSGDLAQVFKYNSEEMTFHPGASNSICLTVAKMSMDHGRFQSRPIALEECVVVDEKLRQWLIIPAE